MSHATTTKAEQHPAGYKAPEKAPEKVKVELLVALLAADWCRGDRVHMPQIREMTLRLLTELGDAGAEARERMEPTPEKP